MRASFLRGLALLSKEADLRRVELVETLSASACGHGSLVLQQEVPLSESRKATFDSFERDILSVNHFFARRTKPLGGNLPLAMSSGIVKTIRRPPAAVRSPTAIALLLTLSGRCAETLNAVPF